MTARIDRRLALAILPLAFALIAAAPKARAPVVPAPLPDVVRVAMVTELGTIELDLDAKHAPITTRNFLRYATERRFDGIVFYRAMRLNWGQQPNGLIQTGTRGDPRRELPPIAHEPTSRTGLRHVDGAVSMARDAPGSAMGDFFIVAGVQKSMDASASDPGYAVFGKVVSGMQVVKRILKARTFAGGAGAMKGQLIEKPIRIIGAKRLS